MCISAARGQEPGVSDVALVVYAPQEQIARRAVRGRADACQRGVGATARLCRLARGCLGREGRPARRRRVAQNLVGVVATGLLPTEESEDVPGGAVPVAGRGRDPDGSAFELKLPQLDLLIQVNESGMTFSLLTLRDLGKLLDHSQKEFDILASAQFGLRL